MLFDISYFISIGIRIFDTSKNRTDFVKKKLFNRTNGLSYSYVDDPFDSTILLDHIQRIR